MEVATDTTLEHLNEKILLVLDLDETLIHATVSDSVTEWDFEVFGYKIILRPFLSEFLDEIKKHFKIAVWSSASNDYVSEISKKIFPKDYPLEFVWGRSKCTFRADYKKAAEIGYFDYTNHCDYIKKIAKIKKCFKFNIERILIIDDTPRKCIDNYGNAVYPSEFLGNKSDNELLLLSQYLVTLKDSSNVRVIEKRFWKNNLKADQFSN